MNFWCFLVIVHSILVNATIALGKNTKLIMRLLRRGWLHENVSYTSQVSKCINCRFKRKSNRVCSLPPSGYRTCAFKNKPPGPARKRIQAAMSESCPVRPAGLDMDMSSLDFWSSPDEPAVISLGNMPGAMQLTRILVSTKVVAIIRVMWMKPEVK